MSKERKKIMLGDAVDAVLNFRDPRLTDAQFTKRLVDELVNDDLAIRLGSTPEYETSIRKNATMTVLEVVREHGLGDRDRVISEAYNKAANSQPRQPNFPYRNSAFLSGSTHSRKHGGT
ncbi:MAG: hypothetical protein ACAH80_12800 [Alphaproteobacteria bacterium]